MATKLLFLRDKTIDMKNATAGLIIFITIFSAFGSFISCSNGSGQKVQEQNDSLKQFLEMENRMLTEPEFELETSLGTMTIRLYPKTPNHRDNFVKLVNEKYFDGMRFHRVIEGFMIQAGDPTSKDTSMIDQWGYGGPAYTVPAEFVKEYRHKKGALAAARKGNLANPMKASSGSQFYIVHSEDGCSHLDGEYTVFGEVIDGMEVVDRIAAVATDPHNRPYNDVFIHSVTKMGPSCPLDLPTSDEKPESSDTKE